MYLYEDSLVQAAKQETEGGSRIVQFLMGAMYADHPKFQPTHQISAARILTEIGSKEAGVFMRLHKPIRPKRAKRAAVQATDDAAQGPLDPELAAIVAQETDGGKTAVQFLIDVMEDNFPDLRRRHRFTPWQCLSACRELIRIGFVKHIPDKPNPPRPKDAVRHRRAKDAAIAKRRWKYDETPLPTLTEMVIQDTAVRDANRNHSQLRNNQFRETIVQARAIEHDRSDPNNYLAINRFRVEKEAIARSRKAAGPGIYDKTLDAVPNPKPTPLRLEAPENNPNPEPAANQQPDSPDSAPAAIPETEPANQPVAANSGAASQPAPYNHSREYPDPPEKQPEPRACEPACPDDGEPEDDAPEMPEYEGMTDQEIIAAGIKRFAAHLADRLADPEIVAAIHQARAYAADRIDRAAAHSQPNRLQTEPAAPYGHAPECPDPPASAGPANKPVPDAAYDYAYEYPDPPKPRNAPDDRARRTRAQRRILNDMEREIEAISIEPPKTPMTEEEAEDFFRQTEALLDSLERPYEPDPETLLEAFGIEPEPLL